MDAYIYFYKISNKTSTNVFIIDQEGKQESLYNYIARADKYYETLSSIELGEKASKI